ncbi:hypothetical protein A8F94_06570 [Bacillus sp. FJAT-27225]|uniref:hypothetical protein n=1 Tax=Bacillus sp. FJAT-27225 TaxID=1743144 RepID=UPI00080C251E|nr:hypothetical protein [Bacillus sp. FJAT-27225]OCA87527.1 hypothetical protein A8F94_06570 [Bacillus sp. FJAT-27225]
MELEIGKYKQKLHRISSIAGFLSFVSALIALFSLNIGLLLKANGFPDFFINTLPMAGLMLGIMGLFSSKQSRLYAYWGIGLCLFIFIFLGLMFGLAWTINSKP